MKIVTSSRMQELATRYRETAHTLHCAAASFSEASEALGAGKLALAESQARCGLFALEKVIEMVPTAVAPELAEAV